MYKNLSKIEINEKVTFYLFSLLCSIIVYGFALTNFSVVPDTESPIYSDYSLMLGRWGTNLIRYHIFEGLMPYYTLLVGLFFLALTAIEIVKIFKIEGIFRYIFVILFLSFPQLSYQMVFTMQADAIGIGFFTVAISVSLFLSSFYDKKVFKYLKWLGVILLLTLTMAIYQALIFCPIIIYAIYFFIELDNKENDNLKNDWIKLFSFIFLLLIASLLYYLSLKWMHIPMDSGYLSSYTSGGENTNKLANFFNLLKANLMGDFYYGDKPYILTFAGILLSIILFIIKRKRALLKVIIFLFLLIFPFFISYFITSGGNPPRLYVSTNIVFAFVIIYLLSKINLKYSLQIMFLSTILFLWNTYYVNALFNSSNKIYQRDLNIAQSISNHITQNINGFDPATDFVYFYGKTSLREYEKNILPNSDIFSGSLFRWDNGNNWRIINFFRITDIAYYRFLDDKNEFDKIKDSISSMPVYPNKGSIKKISNTVIVKLGFDKGVNLPFETEQQNGQNQEIIGEKKESKVTPLTTNLEENVAENPKLTGNLDGFSQNGNKVYTEGWIVYKKIESDKTETYIILYNKVKSYIVPINKKNRPDISDYLGDGTNYNSSGFKGEFFVTDVPKGTYQVRIRIKHIDSDLEGYLNTTKTVTIN